MLWGRPLKNPAKLCIIFDWYKSALLSTLFVRDIFHSTAILKKAGTTHGNLLYINKQLA